MGDTIQHIGAHAVVVNKSVIHGAINTVEAMHGHANARALEEIVARIEASGSAGAATCMRIFLEQLSQPKPEPSKLRALWQDIVTLVPTVGGLPAAIAFIASITGA